ncbi:acyl-CoA carboxylase subunit beta [Modestobacter sp. I12A-02628]|uniref:Acyl-CoA carboxylase subunit beta n=1 Tax=Goekera deserti TaxID=2497753 RepID=A0A7K3WDL7_9ACTN|nr:carboxyl transferase domain-containing protein [Goekera deserti]MPQ97184.1 acyl-CoA carboxylase subunit beta [Goekera deserti]NDI46498.1 acyl-CoA carboxylase subunit beta [Goekera deserti]NEL54568.1 acyl-CoA carboxylase subunit beta [Goekera deserti]
MTTTELAPTTLSRPPHRHLTHPRSADGQPVGPPEAGPNDPVGRLAQLFDDGDTALIDELPSCGVVVGQGSVRGVRTIAYCTDGRVMGGAMGEAGCRRIVAAIQEAVARRQPVVGIWHSGGARLGEGVRALHGVGHVFAAMVAASGKVPQISVVLGAAAGGAAYGPALTDLVIMSDQGRVFVTGPDVIKSVTGEHVTMEALGGGDTHGRRSGVVHVVTDSEAEALGAARAAVALLCDQGVADERALGPAPDPAGLLPGSGRRAYDVLPVVRALLDEGSWFEVHRSWAPNVVTGWGRLAGRTVGVVANNPLRLGGCLDATSAEKAARFVRTCDSFGVPLVVLVDVPGYLAGVGQEWSGVVRRGAKLLYAFAEAVVPRATLVLRKAYGGAYVAMNSRALGASAVFAWPDAEVAVMGAEAAVPILHRKRLAAAAPAERDVLLRQLVAEHQAREGGLDLALDIDAVDEVITPAGTRAALVRWLARVQPTRGQHGNIPL